MLRFLCPTCRYAFQARESWAGRRIRCSSCQELFRIPGPPEAPPVRRDPLLAAVLSFVVPGLGHAYLVRPGTALLFYLGVGLFAWLGRKMDFLPYLTLPAAFLFWGGGIARAWSDGKKSISPSDQDRTFSVMLGIVAAPVLLAFWLLVLGAPRGKPPPAKATEQPQEVNFNPATRIYSDSNGRFSVRVPEGFLPTEKPRPGMKASFVHPSGVALGVGKITRDRSPVEDFAQIGEALKGQHPGLAVVLEEGPLPGAHGGYRLRADYTVRDTPFQVEIIFRSPPGPHHYLFASSAPAEPKAQALAAAALRSLDEKFTIIPDWWFQPDGPRAEE